MWCKPTKVPQDRIITTTIVEYHHDQITDFTTDISFNSGEVFVNSIANSTYHGDIKVDVSFDRNIVQYNNMIYGGAVALINSQSLLFTVGYSYKTYSIDLYGGYSFKLKDYDYGIGGKYFYKF